MMITMWVDGNDHEVSAEQVIPWLCGVNGTLDTVDLGHHHPITVDVDPSATDRPGTTTTYIVEFDGVRRDLAESWVLPWVRGLAARHGVADREVFDPDAAGRAQQVQALMVGHQRRWFTYTGFTRPYNIQ
jgi:hypothetical protein